MIWTINPYLWKLDREGLVAAANTLNTLRRKDLALSLFSHWRILEVLSQPRQIEAFTHPWKFVPGRCSQQKLVQMISLVHNGRGSEDNFDQIRQPAKGELRLDLGMGHPAYVEGGCVNNITNFLCSEERANEGQSLTRFLRTVGTQIVVTVGIQIVGTVGTQIVGT